MWKTHFGIAAFLFFVFNFFLFTSGATETAVKPQMGCKPIYDEITLKDEYDPNEITGEYLGQAVNVPEITDSFAYVLGDQATNKRIEVNLANQHVYAFEDNTPVFDFVVSTGKWYPTPKGTFTIQRKVRAQKMSGGSKALRTYYYLPNVPWVMFYGNKQIPWSRGFSFHGAYWHNNFGTPMSHGCVNMKIPDSEQLYNWAPVGTRVIVY